MLSLNRQIHYKGGIYISHKNKESLVRQVQKVLENKLAIGESKHVDKKLHAHRDKIYSWNTFRTYMKHSNYFVTYCKENHGCKTLDQCRSYVDEWLQIRIDAGLSAYTQKLEASALAKLYGCSTTDFIKTETRNRNDIVRSRGGKVRDTNFNEERHKDLVDFCRSTGLRRSELESLRGDQLLKKDDQYYIRVIGKGGRYREAPVIGNIDLVVNKMISAGSDKVWGIVSNAADIHSYRSDYATAIYKMHARPIDQIPYDKINKGTGRKYQSEVYHCRGDQKGQKMDKAAMLEASYALGHNRISVVGEHYIRGLDK